MKMFLAVAAIVAAVTTTSVIAHDRHYWHHHRDRHAADMILPFIAGAVIGSAVQSSYQQQPVNNCYRSYFRDRYGYTRYRVICPQPQYQSCRQQYFSDGTYRTVCRSY